MKTKPQQSDQTPTQAIDVSPQTDSAKATVLSILEPELEEVAGNWDAQKRLSVGIKFERWGKQLQASSKHLFLQSAQPLQLN